ncbi:MAG: hypothetical protein R3A52_00455 [Polyangiales bacterium]
MYRDGLDALTEGERLMMGAHALTAFPAWAVLALHLATAGAFSLVYSAPCTAACRGSRTTT